MYILCIVDQYREPIIERVKTELQSLRQIDNIIKELLKAEEINFSKNVIVFPVESLDTLNNINLEMRGDLFQIPQSLMDKIKLKYRILLVPECTIFVPIFAAPKWVKGLIKEKDFEMQIETPGFTIETENFHLEVVDYESVRREQLETFFAKKLLILSMSISQLNNRPAEEV